MSKATIHVQEPSEEMKQKIVRARQAIATQKSRFLKCPYCQHKAISVFDDTRGHVEAKCVALLTGAWIEIERARRKSPHRQCRPPHGEGVD